MKYHRLIDERSLAFDHVIAAKLRSEPALVEKARGNLARWLGTCSAAARPDLLEWQRLLSGPFDELLVLLETTDERATRLRQSSPFCGILTPEERLDIIREFQARESAAARRLTRFLFGLFAITSLVSRVSHCWNAGVPPELSGGFLAAPEK